MAMTKIIETIEGLDIINWEISDFSGYTNFQTQAKPLLKQTKKLSKT